MRITDLILKKKPELKKADKLSDIVGDEGGILINWTKMNKRIKECKEEKLNKACRTELKNIGISFADEVE